RSEAVRSTQSAQIAHLRKGIGEVESEGMGRKVRRSRITDHKVAINCDRLAKGSPESTQVAHSSDRIIQVISEGVATVRAIRVSDDDTAPNGPGVAVRSA